MEHTVPFYNPYNPSLELMNKEQLGFYNAWCKGMLHGNYPDISGNLGYIYVYISKIFNPKDDPYYDDFIRRVLDIQSHYKEYKKIDDYCNWLISDYYLSKKQFKKALNYYPRKPDPHSFVLLKNAGGDYTIKDAIDEYHYIFGHQT